MSATLVPMPRLSDSMEEGTVVRWLKAPGDVVKRGEALVEIETDKATMVYEAEADGILGEQLVAEGEVAALGAPIAHLLTEGGPPERVSATPVARRVAAELGVALERVKGTGPRGRIVRADVRAAAKTRGDGAGTQSRGESAARREARPAPASPPPASPLAAIPPAAGERVELTATQRTIASRMLESRTQIPEFTLTAELDMTRALALRRELNASGARVSVNDLVVKAVALTLREQPRLNASWAGDHIVRHARVNVGIAVAAEDALLVPVIADADRKSIFEIAAEARTLGERPRTRSASANDLEGATFTVTNLGMFGVLAFDAVINAPQAAILAVGTTARTPAFADDGTVVARDHMQVSLSCDHRAVYGADGARFLARLREALETPMTLLMPGGAR